MKERPILFSAPMVRAILDGTKTQTRRIVKGAPVYVTPFIGRDDKPTGEYGLHDTNDCVIDRHARCPYGMPGDRLWVRETWQYAGWTEDGYPWIRYDADKTKLLHERIPDAWSGRITDAWAELSAPENMAIDGLAADHVLRPSIFLPRWASRITLEVTAVRVERLQAITEEDAVAEGVEATHAGSWRHDGKSVTGRPHGHSFLVLWDSINRDRAPAASNPWVWVVEFTRSA